MLFAFSFRALMQVFACFQFSSLLVLPWKVYWLPIRNTLRFKKVTRLACYDFDIHHTYTATSFDNFWWKC